MKLFLALSMFATLTTPAFAAETPPCQDQGKVYKICGNQEDLYAAGMRKAKLEKKNLVVVIGAEWCPWCMAMHQMLGDPKFGNGFAKKFVLADIGLYSGKVKVPTGEAVLAKLQVQAHHPEKIAGIPVMAMVNPKNLKAVLIDTEPLEKNTETTKGHDPAKVLAAMEKAAAELK